MQLLDRAVIAVQRSIRNRRRERAQELAAVGVPVERKPLLPARRTIATAAAATILAGGLGYGGYSFAEVRLDIAHARGELEAAETAEFFAESRANNAATYSAENPGNEEARIEAEAARERLEWTRLRAESAEDWLQTARLGDAR